MTRLRWRSASCRAASASASSCRLRIRLSLNTCTAAAMAPISLRRLRPGTATAAFPAARASMAAVITRIGRSTPRNRASRPSATSSRVATRAAPSRHRVLRAALARASARATISSRQTKARSTRVTCSGVSSLRACASVSPGGAPRASACATARRRARGLPAKLFSPARRNAAPTVSEASAAASVAALHAASSRPRSSAAATVSSSDHDAPAASDVCTRSATAPLAMRVAHAARFRARSRRRIASDSGIAPSTASLVAIRASSMAWKAALASAITAPSRCAPDTFRTASTRGRRRSTRPLASCSRPRVAVTAGSSSPSRSGRAAASPATARSRSA
ncbi:hypothetical protein AU375_01115 [Methylobacterium radiotolerans]|nr:hypothetical protein AU375_01115 [Methylobacterium radiotolerans]